MDNCLSCAVCFDWLGDWLGGLFVLEQKSDVKEIVKLKKKRSYTIKADGTTIILYEDGSEVITDKNGKLISVK